MHLVGMVKVREERGIWGRGLGRRVIITIGRNGTTGAGKRVDRKEEDHPSTKLLLLHVLVRCSTFVRHG